jgi:hypothetical protein
MNDFPDQALIRRLERLAEVKPSPEAIRSSVGRVRLSLVGEALEAHKSTKMTLLKRLGVAAAVLLAVAGLFLLLPGRLPIPETAPEAHETAYSDFAVKDAPKVIASTFNGLIAVSTGVEGKVRAKISKFAGSLIGGDAKENIKAIGLTVIQKGDEVRIEALEFSKPLFPCTASIELEVPAGATLDLHTNGPVTVCGPVGSVSAQTRNGYIEIKKSCGTMDLNTKNGAIRIQCDKAAVTAHACNGPIEFAGTLAEGKHVFETSNGQVRIILPSKASFLVNAETANGQIHCDFPLQQKRSSSKSHLIGTVGDRPRTEIEVKTSNAEISILEKKIAGLGRN